MTIPASIITANSLTAETLRQALSSLIAGTGVIGTGDLQVSANGTPNMSVNVAAGQGWIPGTLSSTTGFPANINAQTGYGLSADFNEQASYPGWNNGTVNLVISAADPTNGRIDLVVASIEDAQYSGSNNQPVLQVITGTPAPSPVAPSAPASSVVLAQVSVSAGATSITSGDITDERPRAGLISPVQPVCRVYRNAAYTTGTALAIVPFDTVSFDNESGFSTSTHLYTCPDDGYYRVYGQVFLNSPTDGAVVQASIYRNGVQAAWTQMTAGATQNEAPASSDLLDCSKGDTISLYGASASSAAIIAGSVYTYMTIERVSI